MGVRDDKRDAWLYWCIPWRQVMLNTWDKQPPRYLWTLETPNSRHKNQIHYVTTNTVFRNAVTEVIISPGGDCVGNLHRVPVVADITLRLER